MCNLTMSIILLPVLNILKIILSLYLWVIFGMIILSWLTNFGIINSYNGFVMTIQSFLQKLTEPLLRPIRRVLPNLGGFDLSPLVLVLAVILLRDILTRIQIAYVGL